MSIIRGKALLVIDRLNSEHVRYDIHAFIRSCTPGTDASYDCVQEAFWCAACGAHSVPNAAYKMQIGDRLRIAVTYQLTYTQDYWGEWDSDLVYLKERVLRRQPYKGKP